MNLKESFRYQKYLDSLMSDASYVLLDSLNYFSKTEKHYKVEGCEVVTTKQDGSPSIDVVIMFMDWIVRERYELCEEIWNAKQQLEWDLDAKISSNKFRREMCVDIAAMMKHKTRNFNTQETGYKFTSDGNQVPYKYNVDVELEYAYDREKAHDFLLRERAYADTVSNEIEMALLTTTVNFYPVIDVNLPFEEAIEEYKRIFIDSEP